jgi:hypothetical protein
MVQISICIIGNISLNRQIVVGAVLYRTWKAQVALNSNTLPLEEWIKEEVSRRPLNTSSAEEMDLRFLSRSLQFFMFQLRMHRKYQSIMLEF